MAGRPGRNRAWNKLPVEVHLQRGTFRADRHQAGGLRRVDDTEPAPAPLAPELVSGLAPGSLGLAFIDEAWSNFAGWNPASLILLRQAGLLINQAEQLRGEKTEHETQKLLLATLAQLRLP